MMTDNTQEKKGFNSIVELINSAEFFVCCIVESIVAVYLLWLLFVFFLVVYSSNQDMLNASFSFSAGVSSPEEISPNVTELAAVKEVYDGDTIVVTVTKEYRIRMLDCWAPEITGDEKEDGLKSKQFLESMLVAGDEVFVKVPTTNRIQDSITFGRVLAYVYKDIDGDGEVDNISEKMVENGFATKEKVKK